MAQLIEAFVRRVAALAGITNAEGVPSFA